MIQAFLCSIILKPESVCFYGNFYKESYVTNFMLHINFEGQKIDSKT